MPIGLENYIVNCDYGVKYAPEEAVQIVLEETAQGVPTGFAFKDGKWYVIQSSGQGPYILWKQDDTVPEME